MHQIYGLAEDNTVESPEKMLMNKQCWQWTTPGCFLGFAVPCLVMYLNTGKIDNDDIVSPVVISLLLGSMFIYYAYIKDRQHIDIKNTFRADVLANEDTLSRAEIFKNRRRTKYAAQGSIGGVLILIWALKSDIFNNY
ncbi:MAG: hypothetical protein R6U31_07540 [bacterium]